MERKVISVLKLKHGEKREVCGFYKKPLDLLLFAGSLREKNKISNIFKTLVCLLMFAVFFAGYEGKEGVSQELSGELSKEKKKMPQKLSGELKIAGCNGLRSAIQECAKRFMEKYPKVKITVSGGGCDYGIKGAGEGEIDIGLAGRNAKPEEKEKYPDLKLVVIGKKAIAIIVHSNNPVRELTLEQASKIFAGDITNWKELGGFDKDIHVIIREEGIGRKMFEKLVMRPYKKKITANATVKLSYEEVKATVSKDKSSIGYILLGYLDNTVKPLKINGVEPTIQNVLSGDYPITKTFYLITKGEPSELEKAFIDFVLSEEGQKIMEDMGYIRIKIN